jgi:hypothetical protein
MADTSVFINGVADGAFVDALNGLPPWATEDTASQIEGTLKKLLGIQTNALSQLVKGAKAGGALNATQVQKTNDELDKFTRNLKRVNEEDAKVKKSATRKEKEDKDEETRTKKKKTSDEAMSKIWGALAAVGAKVLESQTQYFETSDDLFKSGVNLLNGNDTTSRSMMALNQIVTLTNVRLEIFQKIVEKYSSSINAVGVTKFAKTISLASVNLTKLGYSSQDQIDLIGNMIESESAYSDLRGKTQQELASDAEQYGKQIKNLSLLTGQSVDKLKQNTTAASKNSDIMAVQARYGKEAADRVLALSAAVPEATDSIIALASSNSKANEAVFQMLAKSGTAEQAQAFSDTITQLTKGTIDAETAVKKLGDNANKFTDAQILSLRTQVTAGTEGAKGAQDFIYALRGAGNKNSKATQGQTDAATKSQASIAAFSSALEESRTQMQRAFPLLEDQLDLATGQMKMFNNAMHSLTDIIDVNTRSWIGAGLVLVGLISGFKLIGQTFSILGDVFPTVARALAGLAGPIKAVTVAFVAGYAVGTAIYAMISNFKWFNNMMDKIFSGLDHIIQHIPGIGGDAKERIATREKLEQMGSGVPGKSEISVPKNPSPSTINSPSAVPATPANTQADTTSPVAAETSQAAVGSGIEKPPRTSDINSLLTYQSAILEQILNASNNLVSVNRDILKYSKVH